MATFITPTITGMKAEGAVDFTSFSPNKPANRILSYVEAVNSERSTGEGKFAKAEENIKKQALK
jgi:hypothetical protein